MNDVSLEIEEAAESDVENLIFGKAHYCCCISGKMFPKRAPSSTLWNLLRLTDICLHGNNSIYIYPSHPDIALFFCASFTCMYYYVLDRV